MFAVSPVRVLVKVPPPVPSVVNVELAVVGFADVLQHTPRAVTVAPPSEVTFPPLVAVVEVIAVTTVVVTIGSIKEVANRIHDPAINIDKAPVPADPQSVQ